MKNAKLLLEQLTEMMPPGEGQRHNLTIENGNMVVCLMLGERYLPFTLEESDLGKFVNELAGEIVQLAQAAS